LRSRTIFKHLRMTEARVFRRRGMADFLRSQERKSEFADGHQTQRVYIREEKMDKPSSSRSSHASTKRTEVEAHECPHRPKGSLIQDVVIVLVVILAVFILREFFCWFFKTNHANTEIMQNQRDIRRIERVLRRHDIS